MERASEGKRRSPRRAIRPRSARPPQTGPPGNRVAMLTAAAAWWTDGRRCAPTVCSIGQPRKFGWCPRTCPQAAPCELRPERGELRLRACDAVALQLQPEILAVDPGPPCRLGHVVPRRLQE